jgi:hypothetical protein
MRSMVTGCELERDEEKWLPVFLINYAIPHKLKLDGVSFKHHPATGAAGARKWALNFGRLPGLFCASGVGLVG